MREILFTIKCWCASKFCLIMELFGLYIPDYWFLLRTMYRELGKDEALIRYTQAILLRIKYGSFPTRKRFKTIVENTSPNMLNIEQGIALLKKAQGKDNRFEDYSYYVGGEITCGRMPKKYETWVLEGCPA